MAYRPMNLISLFLCRARDPLVASSRRVVLGNVDCLVLAECCSGYTELGTEWLHAYLKVSMDNPLSAKL